MNNRRDKFILNSIKIHGDKYNYESVEYVNNRTRVEIFCNVCENKFCQLPSNHTRGNGCHYCGKSDRVTTEEFIKSSILKHGNKYDYTYSEYTNRKEKLTITCPVHGDFEQIPNNHLLGKGCPQCKREKGGWSKTEYIKRANGRESIFYILKVKNETEEFYKIGITSLNVHKRYNNVKRMPYSYEIIKEIKGEAGKIWDIELEWKRKLKEFKYVPKIKFKGMFECFSDVNILLNNIEYS